MTTTEAPNPDGIATDHAVALQRLENSSGRATLLILAGIVIEILAILIFSHSDMTWWERGTYIIANAGIGVGLAIECIVIRKTVLASAAQKRESDQQVATASRMAAEAHLQAAEAHRQAEALKAEAGWRELGAYQREAIRVSLAKGPAAPVKLVYVANDAESRYFVSQFHKIFTYAGWSVALEATSHSGDIVFGIVVPREYPTAEAAEAAQRIQSAFSEAKVQCGSAPQPRPYVAGELGDALHGPTACVYIGPKLRPRW
jgi:hypothetical protein